MRLLLASMLLAAAGASAQSVIAPALIPRAATFFERTPSEQTVSCEVKPIPARLGFSLRFEAGYVARVPMKQYFGKGHSWLILTRITPQGGGQPVYLGRSVKLPDIPKTKSASESGGVYVLGAGRYAVDWVLADESNRVCRAHWSVDAKPGSGERGLKMGMEPSTVAGVTFRRWSAQGDTAADVRPIRRLTVLLHAAPIFPRSTRFRARDRGFLLTSLASLLDSLPAKSVRLVVFNLDQQRELIRQDVLTPEAFDPVAQSMNNLELGLVDYRVLQNQRGHLGLLAGLVNQELRAAEPSDAVVFIGPPARFSDKLPETMIEGHSGGAPQFFYLEYKLFARNAPDLPDSIESAIKDLRGKTIQINSPDGFAKAIKHVEAQMTRGN
jgi:hypothetical protein